MKLLTISDGFGDSNIGPEWYSDFVKWPEIIKLMTKGVELINLSRYGAGNEYISQCLKNNVHNNDAVLVQWVVPDRLDLVLGEHCNFWQQQIDLDPVYNNNVLDINNDQYWLSSGSQNSNIKEYHSKYICLQQHQLRSQLFVDYAKLLCEAHNVAHGFLLTVDSKYLEDTVKDTSNWCWHEQLKGMDSFRLISTYADLDATLNLMQPISLVQFEFIKKFIVPKFSFPWRNVREIDAVENMLYRKYKEAVVKRDDSL